ncbi:MAG: hydroxylase, partial [Tetrasphaera sp.]|nr:hydroxylase [Tetrasphaera sp.]
MSDVSCPDSADRTATVDLLGMLALGELTAFSRLAADADMAPAVAGREAFARLALVEFGHYELLLARLRDLTGAPEAAMAPYAPVFAA